MAAKNKGKKEPFVLREQYETLQSEFLACQRKLQSKDEAVKILRRELEICQEEKEDCVQQMNQIKNFLIDEHKPTPVLLNDAEDEEDNGDKDIDYPKRIAQLESHIAQSRQRHKEETQALKEKLSHARNALSSSSAVSSSDLAEERTLLISQLETAQAKISELQRDVQSLEDEKEDLTSERDYFAGKCTSLSKCLESKESSKPPSLNTLEHLLEENRKLKVDLVECEAERDSALSKIERYKRAVERRKAKESQNEALQSMPSGKLSDLRQSVKRVQELDSLANSLSEEIKEKSLALLHQKKTNKLLGTRIAELEHRLKVLEISGLWTTSSLNSALSQTPSLTPLEANINFSNDTIEEGETGLVENGRTETDSLCTSTTTVTPTTDKRSENGMHSASNRESISPD